MQTAKQMADNFLLQTPGYNSCKFLEPEDFKPMTDTQKLKLGIEIISAMKASVYNADIESGRLMALEDTELDRLKSYTLEEYGSLDEDSKAKIKAFQEKQKAVLHEQALFVADAVLQCLNKEAGYHQIVELQENIRLKREADKIYSDFITNVKLDPSKYKGDGKFLFWNDSHNEMYFQLKKDEVVFICDFLHEHYVVTVTPEGIFNALKAKCRGVQHLATKCCPTLTT